MITSGYLDAGKQSDELGDSHATARRKGPEPWQLPRKAGRPASGRAAAALDRRLLPRADDPHRGSKNVYACNASVEEGVRLPVFDWIVTQCTVPECLNTTP